MDGDPGQPGSPMEDNARTPQRLREYVLLEPLGAGGMGTVYKARHTRLDRLVAVKLLPPDHGRNQSAIARFEREMKAVGKLDHPHIVRATDAGEEGGRHFLVMELVDGTDLGAHLERRGPLSVAEACEVVRQAALGLQHAHEHGLIHRDLKPSNLMLTQDARLQIPHPVPAEYDLLVEFSVERGRGEVFVIFTQGDFWAQWSMWCYDYRRMGFNWADDLFGPHNETWSTAAEELRIGRRYRSRLEVRGDGVRAFLDDDLIAHWQTDFSTQVNRRSHGLQDAGLLGIGAYESRTLFHRIALRELRAADAPAPDSVIP
jgi:serine/threonine protein kinase